MVSLAFQLFVVGTVTFALCSYDCSRPLHCCRQYRLLYCYDLVVCFWRFELEFFPSWLPCRQPYKFHFEFEANPVWYSAIKFTKSHSAKSFLHKWAWLRHSIKVSSFELYKFDPFLPHTSHSRLISRELMDSYALGCLWVVTVCCNTVGRHG